MCGKGIATRARGMGCNVIVTEVDPVKALQAYMDGFRVMSMSEAAKTGDIFVTASGDRDLIRKEHFQSMKPGAILANSGHFNVEINIKELESISKGKTAIRPNVEEYMLKNGGKIYLLGEGRLVNLAAAEGHPSEVMQMSFANQALCARYLKENKGRLEPKVYNVPKEIDSRVAQLALAAAGIRIDTLSPEQKKYLESWQEGT
jgi:adenosylhomocysteinase